MECPVEADGAPLDTPIETGSRAALVVYKGSEPEADTGPDPVMSEPEPERRTLAYAGADNSPADSSEAPPARSGTAGALEPEPRRIGDFLVRRLIGEGGMGKVYEAEERLSKRRVALKVLRSELSRSEVGRRQFVNEMGILASLDDPHVVRCLHCTEVDGELIMALEFLEGQTLRERMLQERALAWDEVVAIAWQIAAALEAAHAGEQPIIHRDLKPENVMLLDGGRVKVMDFGIAKIVQAAAGNTTHSVGTLQYMSPEQIDARPLSPRSDLYALGLVMWELLAGRPPFEAESPRVLLDKLCTEPAPQLPAEARRGLPRGVEQLVMQLLEKAPEARPASASVVLECLEPFRPAELSTASASRPTTRPGRSVSNEVAELSPATPIPVASPAASPAASSPSSPSSSTAQELAPKRFDTVGVVQQAAAPREIPTKLAASIIVSLSLAAGLVTWLIRLLGS
ncbi:serine/threonine-protein kinase [Enhygromyxa salina]|uniref:Serine/threonine-protein kinase PknH n=1 Tax=Enhygromyxa salina TaxID=215803 RepID=A0A2S9Y6H2_9BACT|nr:serine/threonine-protein kinase [Enhygromyxa salina]PRQ00601.1 Serine/threonine-protein kinase PknH [Enhygromyxa salina]